MASFISEIFKATSLSNAYKNVLNEKDLSKVGDLYIDAVVDENIIYNNTVTDNPVETNVSITDHIKLDPIKVSMRGYITNNPMRFFGIFETPLQKNSLSSVIENTKKVFGLSNQKTPVQQAYDMLSKMRNNKEILTVVTELAIFQNMAIENLEFPKTPENRNRLEFRLTLKKVQFAVLQKTFNNSNRINNVLNKKSNVGIQNQLDGESTNGAAEEENILYKGYKGAQGWIRKNLYE